MSRKTLFLACISFVVVFYFAISMWYSPRKESTVLTKEKPFFITIPITGFFLGQCPLVDIRIQDQTLSMGLDLGFRGDLRLDKSWMDQIHSKRLLGTKSMYGFRGNKHTVDVYSIPEIQMGLVTFHRLFLEEENEEFLQSCVLVDGEDELFPAGRLGWELFSKINILLDLGNKTLFLCDSTGTLEEQGYPINTFAKTPLLLDRGLLEIEVTTFEDPLRCMLDTGASFNFLNSELKEGETIDQFLWNSEAQTELSLFQISGVDLGPITFHHLPIKLPIHIEAVLGADFFDDHLVFIDFLEKQVYIRSNKKMNDKRRQPHSNADTQ